MGPRTKRGLMLIRITYILLLGLLNLKCKSKKAEVQQLIADNCSEHPLAFYMAEEGKAKLYKFGDKDEEFRARVREILQRYRQSGQDITGVKKQDLAANYVPNYLQACKSYFSPVVQKCGQHKITDRKFQDCARPYNDGFRRELQINIQDSGSGLINLELISFKPFDDDKPSQVKSQKID